MSAPICFWHIRPVAPRNSPAGTLVLCLVFCSLPLQQDELESQLAFAAVNLCSIYISMSRPEHGMCARSLGVHQCTSSYSQEVALPAQLQG